MSRKSLLFVPIMLANLASAQDGAMTDHGYLNLDSTTILEIGSSEKSLEFRTFGGHENLTYSTLTNRYGICPRVEGVVRGVIAIDKTAPVALGGTIRYGGLDFEAGFKVLLDQRAGITGFVSVSTPYTPAQKSPVLSLGLAKEQAMGNDLSFTLNPKALLIQGNTLIGIGMGIKTNPKKGLFFSIEHTHIVAGENTRDVYDGSLKMMNLFGLAAHYALPGGNANLSMGYTNATGGTTGFGLTPGLGGSGALFISLRGRY